MPCFRASLYGSQPHQPPSKSPFHAPSTQFLRIGKAGPWLTLRSSSLAFSRRICDLEEKLYSASVAAAGRAPVAVEQNCQILQRLVPLIVLNSLMTFLTANRL